MTRHYLAHRIDTLENLNRELGAWKQGSNAQTKTPNWNFKSVDAPEKLKSLYPKLSQYGFWILPYFSNRHYTSNITVITIAANGLNLQNGYHCHYIPV